MTGAERVRRYRLKRGPVTNGVTKPTDPGSVQLAAEFAQAEDRIRDLEAQLARAKAEITELQIEAVRTRNAAAKGKASKAKAAAVPRTETELERENLRLKEQARIMRRRLRDHNDWRSTTGVPETGGMSRSTYGKIAKALHPDQAPSEADRMEGCQAFNAWAESLKRRF